MRVKSLFTAVAAVIFLLAGSASLSAQDFDFEKLEKKVSGFTVVLDMTIEVSFGMNSSEEQESFLGTIVSKDGLVIFNGAPLIGENGGSLRGMNIKTEPTKIEVSTQDGRSYDATYMGVDRFTKIGFAKLDATDDDAFEPVEFVKNAQFKTGDWLALYMLLPDYIEPPLAADVGMISTIIESPEEMPLTIGFSTLQMTSVLFDKAMNAVGVLGLVLDPASASMDMSGMLESMGQMGRPVLGVITSEKLERIIADPPQKGTTDRGWLGISLQALTADLADFWNLDSQGGIIVNNVVASSPAFKAGIKTGDIILEVNGQPVDVDREDKIPVFQRSIAEMGPHASVELTMFRPADEGGEKINMIVELEPTPMSAADAPEYESKVLEFKVRDMVFSDYMIFNLDQDEFYGVVVTELKQGGLSNVGGLGIGDIIQRIDNESVDGVESVEGIMARIESEKPGEVIFFVWRDNKTLFVNVKTDW
ncbi:MAG: PDZ domain-containing protein [bacterium]|nr:PDZ domain-containing protein [bacterium]